MAGDADFCFMVSTKGADNDRIEQALQDVAERMYGDRKFAFATKIYPGKENGKVFLFVPPPYYNEVKRLQGRSGSLKRLKALMTKLTSKTGRGAKQA